MSSEFEVSAAEPSVAEFATQLPTVVVAGVPLGYIERRYPLRNPIPDDVLVRSPHCSASKVHATLASSALGTKCI